MRFGFVTDELSQDPREAVEMALEWGVREFEIRHVHDKRFPRLPLNMLDRLVDLQDEYDIAYTAVSPGFFKTRIDDEPHIAYATGEGLHVAVDFMQACEIPLLICFGLESTPGTDKEAVARIGSFADQLADFELHAAVENETHCKFNTPERIASLLQQCDRPNLGANWDLANLKEGAEEGFPDGYETVKEYIRNVHAKDVVVTSEGRVEWRPIGEGVCDWRGQMRALLEDQIVERVTIESHCGPPEHVGQHNLTMLKRFVEEAGG
ncbi:MAG: sugar phosphate isomerase/epimerase [Candidatus Hydrogenedentes bacterium]|nr:sugar phosphate isomerase/epimerase [Candidatus Hydrogenedentota bacterium]